MKIIQTVAIVTVFVALAGGTLSCDKKDEGVAAGKKKLPLVSVAPVEDQALRSVVFLTGTVQANLQSRISTPIDGVVVALKAREHQKVGVEDVVAFVSSHERLSLVASTLNRIKEVETRLRASGAIDEQATALRQEIVRLQRELEEVRNIHKEVPVISPIAGTVTERHVDVGSMVSARDPLITVSDMRSLVVKVQVHEQYFSALGKGRKLKLSLNAYSGDTLHGYIDLVYPHVDASTRTVLVDIRIVNPARPLIPGMLAEVQLPVIRERTSLMIPERAVLKTPDETSIVFIVQADGTARRRIVETGVIEGGMIEIVSGLQAGETVVTDGQERLRDGVLVKVVKSVVTGKQ
ncbi:MAG: efflux RND transporter periplasmic adaptor subunit [Bacteroidetes bacterium]|nr:efflux RND transporter periplasmic adaptor subunit [Bacteroidota bacterium]